MQTSANGLALIKEFEGLRLQAYLCPAKVWTIGYGHTTAAGPPSVHEGMILTKNEAESILRKDLRKYENAVSDNVTVPLTQHQFDALVSFCYNVGPGAFKKSTLLKKLNRREYDAIPAELMKWNKAGGKELAGLTRRRRAEAALWRKIDERSPVVPEEAAIAPDEPKPRKKITQSREANAAAATGLSSAIGLASEVIPVAQQGADVYSTLENVLDKPVTWVLLAVLIGSALIWWFRKQRLEENGE